jgi:hypothetical protein
MKGAVAPAHHPIGIMGALSFLVTARQPRAAATRA